MMKSEDAYFNAKDLKRTECAIHFCKPRVFSRRGTHNRYPPISLLPLRNHYILRERNKYRYFATMLSVHLHNHSAMISLIPTRHLRTLTYAIPHHRPTTFSNTMIATLCRPTGFLVFLFWLAPVRYIIWVGYTDPIRLL